MNVYVRVYWLCFLGVGLLLTAYAVSGLLSGDAGPSSLVVAIVGVLILVGGGVGVLADDRTGAPEEPNALFAVMVLAFLLTLVGFLLGQL